MALWFDLRCNAERIGAVEIRRREVLDLDDQAAIQDAVSTYDVIVDGRRIGPVRHRYGDGAWRLLAIAAGFIADETQARKVERP